VSVAPLYDGRGELKYFLCTLRGTGTAGRAAATGANNGAREISLLQRELGLARQKVVAMDRVDTATGLLRFEYFRETLRRDLLVARRDRRFVSLLVFQIVEFDVYEQTFGDKAAESCLRMVGTQIVRTLRRASDLCARYDEATLVAAVLGQAPEEIQPLADAIADSVSQLKLHNPRAKSNRYITMRVEVLGCPPGAHDDPEPVIARVLERARADDTRLEAISA
jgi:diguanylate cyclase (GGDEF)-like protein